MDVGGLPIFLWIGWFALIGVGMIAVFVLGLGYFIRFEAKAEERLQERMKDFVAKQRHEELVRSGYKDNRTYINNQQNNSYEKDFYDDFQEDDYLYLTPNQREALGPIDALLKSQGQPRSRPPHQ